MAMNPTVGACLLAPELVYRGTVHVKALGQPESRTQKKFKGDGSPRGGGTDPQNFFGPMNSNFGDIGEKRSKMSLFDKKCVGGGVPPAPTPKITTPSDFSYPHCLFTMTLLRSSGDV